jgi:hypothetical protein
MFLSNVFYPEIVHDKGERDGSPFVAPEAGSVDALKISMGGEPFPEEFVGEYPGLREAPYSTFHP